MEKQDLHFTHTHTHTLTSRQNCNYKQYSYIYLEGDNTVKAMRLAAILFGVLPNT